MLAQRSALSNASTGLVSGMSGVKNMTGVGINMNMGASSLMSGAFNRLGMGGNKEREGTDGNNYSNDTFDFDLMMSKDGTYLKAPKNVVFELKYPNQDIKGVVK